MRQRLIGNPPYPPNSMLNGVWIQELSPGDKKTPAFVRLPCRSSSALNIELGGEGGEREHLQIQLAGIYLSRGGISQNQKTAKKNKMCFQKLVAWLEFERWRCRSSPTTAGALATRSLGRLILHQNSAIGTNRTNRCTNSTQIRTNCTNSNIH